MIVSRKNIVTCLCMISFITQLFSQNDTGFKKVDRILTKLVKKKKIPGVAISVSKDGNTIYSKGFGYANIESKKSINPAQTIFRIGSVSKPIAASGLAKLVEENKIDIHKSIYDYLPSFPKKRYDFTLKQLGGHLAGIRNYKGNEFMNNKPLSIREGVDLFKNDPLLFQPGKDYSYTSYSLNLLALIMEEATGVSFEEYVKEKVLSPLGMKKTVADKKQQIENKAVFYLKPKRRNFKEAPEVDNYFKLAGGGYLSTSEDIIKLGNAYLKEGFLPKSIQEEFVNSQYINDNKTYYGVGWQASYDHEGRPYFGHVGNGLGGYGIFYVYPEEQVVLSILVNSSNPDVDKKFNQVISSIFKELDEEKI